MSQQDQKTLRAAAAPAPSARADGAGAAESRRKRRLSVQRKAVVVQRLIRTVKEQILWTMSFDTIEDLTRELGEFVERYNAGWLCQRHGHRTPSQIGAEQRALDRHVAVEIKEAA